jgi:hypothetical protein
VKRLKHLEAENSRLRRAVSDLKLDKLILQEAARGNYSDDLICSPAFAPLEQRRIAAERGQNGVSSPPSGDRLDGERLGRAASVTWNFVN